jgi:hypothetical protein
MFGLQHRSHLQGSSDNLSELLLLLLPYITDYTA